MNEIYCIDCEIEIKLPNNFDNFLGNNKESKPVKYKSGWRCVNCAKKRNK